MKVETKKYEVIEVYIEDKSAKVIQNAIDGYTANGFTASNPTAHYGKQGLEEDKMWYVNLTKKTEIPS